MFFFLFFIKISQNRGLIFAYNPDLVALENYQGLRKYVSLDELEFLIRRGLKCRN